MRFNPAVLLSAAAVAHGFNNSIGPPGISYGDNLPLDNTSYIDSFRTIYNATSHASFAGPNVSTPLPVGGSYPEHQGNWSMDLFIVADAEPAGSRPDQKPFYTAISIEMRGPEGFRAATDMDRSWTVCNSVALIDAKGHKAVNGSCEGILSDECQKSAYTKATDCSASFFQNGGDKCGLQLKYAVAGSIGRPTNQDMLDRTDSLVWRTETAAFDASGIRTERHDAGNHTAYDQALDYIYVLPVVFKVENGSPSALPGLNTRFVCLQASTFAEGSRTSSAGRLSWSYLSAGLVIASILLSAL